MKTMKGINVVLMEMVVVTLFFSLSAVIILQLYAKGYEISNDSRYQTNALVIAQDWAEQIYANGEQILKDWERNSAADYSLYCDEDMNPVDQSTCRYQVKVSVDTQKMQAGSLYQADVSVLVNGKRMVTLPVARYVPGEADSQ